MAHPLESPQHYNNNWAVGDFIRDQGMNFHIGNAIKYLSRYKKKNGVEDLRKAIHYIENEIDYLESELCETIPESIQSEGGGTDPWFIALASSFDR